MKSAKSNSKKASTDAHIEQGLQPPSQSVEAFSAVDILFTEGDLGVVEEAIKKREDSKWKIALFFETIYQHVQPSTAKSTIFEEALELNKNIYPQLSTEEVIELYNTVVLYGRSYTKILPDKEGIMQATLSLSDLMSQSFPKARYIVEPFFEQGTVNMVSAPPNSWKSWLLFLCSIHISQGTELFGKFPTEQSKIMIVNEEDSFRAIQDRFKILGTTDPNLPIFFRVANGSKLENKFITSLIEELKEKNINVVIFDSLRSMHEADENDSTAMQKILDQMKKIAREGVTVIFTHHHRKKGLFEKSSSAESSRGSSAINAAISGHISLDEEERDNGLFLVIRHLKSKAGEKLPAFEVKIIKEEGKVEFVYDGEFKASEKKLKQTKDLMVTILNDGKWKTMKDFEEISAGKDIKRQALQSLKNDGMLLSITRKQAIEKSIPVTAKGRHNELYYCLNTETSEYITREDEMAATSSFDDY